MQGDERQRNFLIKALQAFINIEIVKFPPPPYLTTMSKNQWDYLNVPLTYPRFCPYCLKQDKTPYFRDSWFSKPHLICPIHRCALLDSCPQCNSPVKFWKTCWNEKITCCSNCHHNITENVAGVFHLQTVDFHTILEKVSQEGIFNAIVVDKFDFFRQLWQLIQFESQDPLIKGIKGNDNYVPVEMLLRATFLGLRLLTNDPGRISCPIIGRNKGKDIGYFTIDDFQNDERNLPKELSNNYVIERVRAIAPLLQKSALTLDIVKRQAQETGCCWKTIYNWLRLYRDRGIAGLNPNRKNSGRKPKQFPLDFERELGKLMQEYILGGEKTTIRQFFNNCKEEADKTGLPTNSLTYATIRKRILIERQRFQR